MKKQNKKGITMLEILIVIAIITIISTIVVLNLSSFRNERAVRNTTEDVISLLNEARNNTISSLNSLNYAVHFDEDKATLFSGVTFDENNSDNKILDFEQSVAIPNGGISLNGGGDDVIFEKITGNTDNYGTITIQVGSDASLSQVININKLGVISKN